MFDIKMIKHILYYELRWNKSKILKMLAVVLFLLICMFAFNLGKDFFYVISCSALFVIVGISQLSGLINAGLPNSQLKSQSLGFSWKLIHNNIRNRYSFYIATFLTSLIICLPVALLTAMSEIILFGNYYFLQFLLFFVLVIAFFRANQIYCAITSPNKNFYIYNKDTSLKGWVKYKASELFQVYSRLAFTCNALFLLLVFLEDDYEWGIVLSTTYLLFSLFFYYRKVDLSWTEEKYRCWSTIRDGRVGLVHSLLFTYLTVTLVNKYLIESNHRNMTSFYKSISLGDIDAVNRYVEDGENLEYRLKGLKGGASKYEGMTALLYATFLEKDQIVKVLLEKNADINAVGKGNIGVASYASYRCNLSILKRLVKYNVDINQQSELGNTPLHYTIHNNCLVGIIYLRRIGADTTLENERGENYIEYAKRRKPHFFSQISFYDEYIDKIEDEKDNK